MSAITIDPPLGKVTTVRGKKEQPFTALVRDPSVTSVELLWKRGNQTEWSETTMNGPLQNSSPMKFIFSLELNQGERIEFDVKLFSRDKMVESFPVLNSGVVLPLCVREVTAHSLRLSDLFSQPDPALKSSPISPSILSVEGPAEHIGGSVTTVLGSPVNMEQYVALERKLVSWLTPATGKALETLGWNHRGAFFAYQRSDALHVVVLPMSGTPDSCTTHLQVNDNREIELVTQNDSSRPQISGQRVLIGVGSDLAIVTAELFAASKQIIYGDSALPVSLNEKFNLVSLENSAPKGHRWYDGLIYCTWNGLGPNLSHNRIMDILKDLHVSGMRITGIIIDDGWQSTTANRELYDIEARKDKFPQGLKGLVTDIRQTFPYIKDVGVWSTIAGYWDGILPGSKIDDTYNTVDAHLHGRRTVRLIDQIDIDRFFDDYFSFLAESGISCVKIDSQATIDELDDPLIRGKLWKPYQDALWKHASKYFHGQIIYCMAMVQNIMLYSLQGLGYGPGQSPTVVFRNSDDFFPEILDSHFWHVYVNFYNCLYTSNLSSVPDFDMFQTKLDRADPNPLLKKIPSLHAAARCLSGGPVYFTDSLSVHDLELVKAMSARSPNGTDIVLRPNKVGKPQDPYRSFTSKTLMRVSNQANRGDLLGLFNITDSKLVETLSGNDELAGAYNAVWYSYKNGEIHTDNDQWEISLASGEWDVYTRIELLKGDHKLSNKIGVLGLLDNIAGICAVNSVETVFTDSHVNLTVYLKAFGTLGLYVESEIGSLTARVVDKDVSAAKISDTPMGAKGRIVTVKVDGLAVEGDLIPVSLSIAAK